MVLNILDKETWLNYLINIMEVKKTVGEIIAYIELTIQSEYKIITNPKIYPRVYYT